jgi:hypothetical protein
MLYLHFVAMLIFYLEVSMQQRFYVCTALLFGIVLKFYNYILFHTFDVSHVINCLCIMSGIGITICLDYFNAFAPNYMNFYICGLVVLFAMV